MYHTDQLSSSQSDGATPNQREPDTRDSEEPVTAETSLETCPECDGRLVDHPSRGERACEDCGLVIDADRIDQGPEWRSFSPEEKTKRSRVGAPTSKLLHDRGLTTRIDWRDVDAYGSTLTAAKRRQMNRLRIWDERFRTRDSSERNLKHALGEIDRMASALGVTEPVRETASVIYRRALEDELLPGRSIEGMATAALYAATRQSGAPRAIEEVIAVSRVDGLEIKRTYRYLARELDLTITPPDPLEYLGRYASKLEVSPETEQRARELLEQGKQEAVHSGKHPVGLAAAALYAAGKLTNESLPQHRISDAADVSEVTIRNRYRELLDAAETTA